MKSAWILKAMGKIDAHSLRIKMMALYLHYLATNRCTKAFIFDEIQNLNFPPKINKSTSRTSQDFFFDFISDHLVQWSGAWPITQETGVQFPLEATFSAIFFFKIFFLHKESIIQCFLMIKAKICRRNLKITHIFILFCLI